MYPRSRCWRIVIRIIRMLALFLGLVLLTFSLAHFSPIDPIQAYLGADSHASPEQIEALKAQWGLDKPFYQQFFKWIFSLLKGDFGNSRLYHRPVIDVVGEAFINSFVLMMVSWLFSGVLGYVLGVLAAFHRGKLLDRIIRWYSYILVSVPANMMGLFLLVVLGVLLKLFPIGLSAPVGILSKEVTFAQKLHHFILPCLTLSLLGVAYAAMHTRRQVIAVLGSEYILFAKARGFTKWELFTKHTFKNSVIPVLIVQFAGFSELFGGSALAENVFAYHGLGSVMTQAGLKGDLPLLLGAIIISSLFVFFGNMLADLLSEKADPRIVEAIYE